MTPSQAKEARRELGLSQFELACVMGYRTPDAVRDYEQGRLDQSGNPRLPPPLYARLLAAYLAGYRPDDWPV